VAEHTFFSELCSRIELCYWKTCGKRLRGSIWIPTRRSSGRPAFGSSIQTPLLADQVARVETMSRENMSRESRRLVRTSARRRIHRAKLDRADRRFV
jgi:hypothetical protein